MVWSGRIDINMLEMEWYLMRRDGIDVVKIDFPYFSLSFHFSYSSLPFSPPFISFSLLFSSFLHFIFSSLLLSLISSFCIL